MTSRDLTILSFAVLFALAALLAMAAHLRRDLIATFSEIIRSIGRRRPLRVIILLTWAWLGWHFLAR